MLRKYQSVGMYVNETLGRQGPNGMRKIMIQTYVSLDGMMQAPGAPDEDPSDGFALGGWTLCHWHDSMDEIMSEEMAEDYDLLLGRRTYDIFAAHWPNAGDDDPVATKFNKATKYVVTSTPDTLEWENSQAITGDIVAGISKLRQGDGLPLCVAGSSQLVHTLLEHQLFDEILLWTFPLILGSGKRLFAESGAPTDLELISHRTSQTGVTMTNYRSAGGMELHSPTS
jgi:dihydrofolate reductase